MDDCMARGKCTCTIADGKLDVEVRSSLYPTEILLDSR